MGVGLATCGVAHLMGTTVPYAVFGIIGSGVAYAIALAIWKPTRSEGGHVVEDNPSQDSSAPVSTQDGERA